MGKPYPIELRERVVEHVLAGRTHRSAAARFELSTKCVHDVMKLYRTTGSVAPKAQGNPGVGKLVAHQAWVEAQIARKPDLTLNELVAELAEQQGLVVHRSSMGRLLHRLGLSYKKKDCQALEQRRKDVAQDRHIWVTHRQPYMAHMLTRLAFVDETWLKTNIMKRTGWAPRGQRLVDYAPYGHWQTQTFVAALRHNRLDAPWVIDGTMNKQTFETYIQSQLAPTLKPGDVVILDNLSSHKSANATQTLKNQGSWFLFFPPYSPDLNPIEMAFSKLKALVRKAAARTFEQLWDAVGHVCDLFTDEECFNFFNAAGYASD